MRQMKLSRNFLNSIDRNNHINRNDNKWLLYIITTALNREKIVKNSQRILKIKLFINKYNWEEIFCPSEKDDWKKFEKNNPAIALNALHVKKEKIYPA